MMVFPFTVSPPNAASTPNGQTLAFRWSTPGALAEGSGILQRSGRRGDPSEAGRGKFLLTSFKSTKPVERRRRFCSVAIARNRACARGKFLFTGRGHGVSLRASRMQLGVGL